MGQWLERLMKTEDSTPKGPAKPAKGGYDGFAGRPTEESPDLRPGFADSTQPAIDLHNAIKRASSWADLSKTLGRAQVAFEAGEIDQETAENLAVLAAQEAHTLPEEPPDTDTPDDHLAAHIRGTIGRSSRVFSALAKGCSTSWQLSGP